MKNGGKLLAKGSKSCVFTPSIPCSSDGKSKKNKISKITYGTNAKEALEQEIRVNGMVNSINNYQDWCLTFEEFCKPMKLDKLMNIDNKGLNDCLKDENTNTISDFDFNSQMLIGEYGGITLDKYFSIFSSITEKNLENEFLKLMVMLKPLFLGLVELKNNEIVHKDIKYNNIVEHNNTFKFIDFGLSSKLSNKYHFENRARREFSTSRIYTWYPLEYLYNYEEDYSLNKELYDISINDFRSGYELFYFIHKIWDRDHINIVHKTVKNIISH